MSTDVPALPRSLDRLRRALPAGTQTWLVGGAVRDLLLGRPIRDLDLTVAAGALTLARGLARELEGVFVSLDEERGCARIVRSGPNQGSIDLADFRAPTLEEDLRARDVTINALAIDLAAPDSLIDPSGGRADLEAGIVRLTSAAALEEDPLRTLRAVRLAAQLAFALDRTSQEWIARSADSLDRVAAERVRDAGVAILATPAPHTAVDTLDRLGLLQRILPSAAGGGSRRSLLAQIATITEWLAGGSLQSAAAAPASVPLEPFRAELGAYLDQALAGDRPRSVLLLLAALLPVGPAEAEACLQHLRFARVESRWVAAVLRAARTLVALDLDRPLDDRQLHRFHLRAGSAAPGAGILALAEVPGVDPAGARGRRVAEILEAYFRRAEAIIEPTPLLDGHDIAKELGLTPGPRLGRVLSALVEEQAAGAVTTREEALSFLRRAFSSDR